MSQERSRTWSLGPQNLSDGMGNDEVERITYGRGRFPL